MAIVILFCFLQLLSSSFQFSVAQTQATNITLGSILSAGNTSASWLSPSGDFAFGFYPVLGDRFLVGIWFHKIPDKTLVWSANRDRPVNEGSTLELTRSGWLVVQGPQGSGSFYIHNEAAASSASMQNNGNFVLRDSSSMVIWQSFDSPTDTLLPGQVLNKNQKLFSSASGGYSTGRYMLKMQDDGNLVMSAAGFTDQGYWWTTEGEDLRRNQILIFNESSALMYLEISNTDIIHNVGGKHPPAPIGDYYHRAMIDDMGNFKQYACSKMNGTWSMVWSAPDHPCYPTALCGAYGYCVLDGNEPRCRCLQGYSPLDLNNLWKGCYADIPLRQSCEADTSVVYEMEDTDFPNHFYADLSQIANSDKEICRKAVMEDCSCIAAVLENGQCRKKRAPLLNGRERTKSFRGRIAFIKVATSNKGTKKSRYSKALVAGLVPSSILAVLVVALALYCYVACSSKQREPASSEINLRAYTYKELKEATDGFTRKLGRGAFGTVYSGILRSEGKQIEVAVKRLEKVIEEGEKEFKTELRVIGRTHHKNLVRLLGFCDENSHRLLVYELMKGGSLSDFLFGRNYRPSWGQRAEIALGISRGLSYLHEECETQIIHCDIKPQNVLLDTNCTAKIADFGLAKLLMKDQTRTSTNVRGTRGYMAPEWLKNLPVTMKVDVYSFGVMLLEIICCRRHIDLDRVKEESEDADSYITDWVLSCMKAGELRRLVEQEEDVLSDFKRFERMAMVGLWCVHPDPGLRPSMKRVRQMLEGTFDVGVPPLVTA